jgi:hypothetical protein
VSSLFPERGKGQLLGLGDLQGAANLSSVDGGVEAGSQTAQTTALINIESLWEKLLI